MSDEDQQNQRKRTAKASAAPHKATCACPRCRYRRRAAGEVDVMMPPKSQPGGAPEPGRAPAFDKDMVQSAPSTLNLSNSIVPSTSTAAPHGEAAPGRGATPLQGRRVGAGTAQKNSPGDRLNADLDVGASEAHQDAIDEDTERQRKAQEAIEEQHRQEEQARLDAAVARRVSSAPGPAGPVRPENKQGVYRKADYVKADGVYKVVLPPGHVPGRKTSL